MEKKDIFSNLNQVGLKIDDDIAFFENKEFDINVHITNLKQKIDKITKVEFHDTYLYHPKYFEQLVSYQDKRIYMYKRDQDNLIIDGNDLNYSLSIPSLDYCLLSLNELFNNNKTPSVFLSRQFINRRIGKIEKDDIVNFLKRDIARNLKRRERYYKPDYDEIDVNDFIQSIIPRIHSIKISSKKELIPDQYKQLVTSFIFTLNYNLSTSLTEFQHVNNFRRPLRRLNPSNIEIPKRAYKEKPLYYYQQALSTDNPILEFLSFYQVIEYFYDIVSSEDLMEGVKKRITHPHFSAKNDEYLKHLINFVQGSEKRYIEINSLQLVLKKYLDEESLKKEIKSYDPNYLDILLNKKVKFANAPELKTKRGESFYTKLANRIYNVRNSLIHSKESEKPAYTPFSKNEEELVNELLLIRIIAENVIINSSEELEYY